MKARFSLLFGLLLTAASASAQAPSAATMPLQINAEERRFFELGTTLARGAFAYAELARQATEVSKTRNKIAQVGQLGKLEPVAQRDRTAAREGLAQALSLMRSLNAPPAALAPIQRAVASLTAPLALSADARPLRVFNGPAARTLSSLREFDTLSSLPEDPALQQWLASPGQRDSASVWYGEGEISGLAQIAAAYQMPDLLPPAQQLATDLRGLRDWLALRLPDTPSPEQAALQSALEAFLQQDALAERPGHRSRRALTLMQLQALGDISRRLQTQVLGPLPGEASAQTSSAKV